MSIRIGKSAWTIALLAVLVLAFSVPAKAASVNKSVKIGAGSESGGSSSVNGSISVGRAAIVNGDLNTVNGRIRVESDARVEEVSTVNGSVRIDSGVSTEDLGTVNGAINVAENVMVDGKVEAVNGDISLDRGSRVSRTLSNVNGEIELSGSTVEGDLTTVNGDIELRDAAEVGGDIRIEKPHGWSWKNKASRVPRVVIGPGSRVHGTIRAERDIKLYISETAEVGGVSGEVSMDDAVRFSGDSP